MSLTIVDPFELASIQCVVYTNARTVSTKKVLTTR